MTLDIAIVAHGAAPYLHNLLASLRDRVDPGLIGAVHLWDNASPDATPQLLERFAPDLPQLRVHRSPVNLGHGPALDRLLRTRVRGRQVLVLDTDTEIIGDLGTLPCWLDGQSVFAGQIHPDPPQLYAYLCHLLLDRHAYLDLPPFSTGGAPGLDWFAAVARRGLAWRRLRLQNWVRHYGQGSLRGLVHRGEIRHPLYGFAAAEARRDPDPHGRTQREAELHRRLAACLAGAQVPPLGDLGAGAAAPAAPADPPRLVRDRTPAALLPARLLAQRARRLGLGLAQADALHLTRQLRQTRPVRLLEIGTGHGGALYLASRTARRDARLVTLDLPEWELDDPGEASNRARTLALTRPSQTTRLARIDPLDPSARTWAAQALGGPADLLLIDARRLLPAPQTAANWLSLAHPNARVALTHCAIPGIEALLQALGGAPTPGAEVLFFRAGSAG